MPAAYKVHNPPTVHQTEQELHWCLEKWGVRDYSVDYNVPRAKFGNRLLSRPERAVTVRWIPPGSRSEIVVSSDDQDSIAANLRKLYLGIEAMRLNERRGLTDVMRSAYMQLPAPAAGHWAVLGVAPGSSLEEIERAYRQVAQVAHPDRGGSDEEMAALNQARIAARAEVSR